MQGWITASVIVADTGTLLDVKIWKGRAGVDSETTYTYLHKIADRTDVPEEEWPMFLAMSGRIIARHVEDWLLSQIVAGTAIAPPDLQAAIPQYRVSEPDESV